MEADYFENRKVLVKESVARDGRELTDLAEHFTKYVSRQKLSRFLVRHELFKKVLDIKGSIIECGVLDGDGLMAWAQLSAIYEPYNYHREIIGFDTFGGFPSIDSKDIVTKENPNRVVGGLTSNSFQELQDAVAVFDQNRPLSYMRKVSLVKGDFNETGPEYLEQNQHLLISLCFLDFDLYQPTKRALELFLSRMAKGAILAFDEINNPDWPGEMRALMEIMDLGQVRGEQFFYEPNISYIVI